MMPKAAERHFLLNARAIKRPVGLQSEDVVVRVAEVAFSSLVGMNLPAILFFDHTPLVLTDEIHLYRTPRR